MVKSTAGEQVVAAVIAASEGPDAGHGAAGGHGGDTGKDIVEISINNKAFHIHRGHQTVAAIKDLGGVPRADELAEVHEGQDPPLTPLKDDGAVTIKGGEKFVSYPRDSGSSFGR